MRHVQLESWTDEHGHLGLIVTGTPKTEGTFAAGDGQLIAHDLLEHHNPALIGDPHDELEALGALWFVRSTEIGRFCGPHQALASDVVSVAIDALYDWEPTTRNTRPHDHDDCFHEIIGHARTMLHHEDFPRSDIEEFLVDTLHCLRRGYNRARRRGIELYQFNAVARAVQPYASPEFEGQTFRLSYGNGEARCDEVTWSH